MDEHPSQYAGITSFEDVQANMKIDFSFVPASVDTSIEFDESEPAFRAVWLRNGKNTHYEGSGPNEIIFRYLKNQAEVNSQSRSEAGANKQ